MNKEEYANYDYQTTTIPLTKNNSVKKCCICNNEKIGEFITINDKKYHLCCIEQLQNNWNELKEWLETIVKALEKSQTLRFNHSIDFKLKAFKLSLDKMQEIESRK